MFRKVLILIGILSALVFSPVSVFAEKIDTYKVDVKIEESGDVSVTERMSYDFENSTGKHGIYRSIPLEVGGSKIVLKDVAVYEEGGQADGADINFENNNLNLKIGDINTIVSGIHDYIINYKIERPFVDKNDKENLFFNVIGTDWSVPISNASFLVALPLPLSKNEINIKCFVGENLSTNSCPLPKLSLDKHGLVTAFLVDSININPHEGITLELSIPKSSLTAVPLIDRYINFLRTFWPFLIVVILGIIFLIVWYKKGRDAKGLGVIVPEYTVPEKIHPLMMAGIIRQGRLTQKDFAASIINLAHLGFISIEVKESPKILNIKTGHDTYTLKLEKPYINVDPLDKELLDGLFVEGNKMPGDIVELSKITKLPLVWKRLQKLVKNKLIIEGYFTETINRFNLDYHFRFTKNWNYLIVLVILIFIVENILNIQTVPFYFNFTYIFISIILSLFLYTIFIYTYPSKTHKGALVEERIKGFEMYLSIAEKDRINFENPPEITPEKFSEYLSYAIVLGVENSWAKAFKINDNYKPVWWHGNNFIINSIASDMVGVTNLGGGFSGSSGSFGGGSVGGGFGGGGGGSW